jgi:lysozyme
LQSLLGLDYKENKMYTLGCDVSKYQDNNSTVKRPDFQKLKGHGVQFVFIRASQNTAIDEDFTYNWKAAKDVGLIRAAYHFHEYRDGIAKPTLDQAKFFYSVIKDDIGELPPVVDYERPNQNWPELPSREVGLTNLDIWFNYLDPLTKPGIFYSNPNTVLYNLRPCQNSGNFLLNHKLWIAQYLYKLNPDGSVASPLQQCKNEAEIGKRQPYKGNWNRWTFWQFTDRLDGVAYGMESAQLDGDFYNGSLGDLIAEFKINETTTPVLTFEERLTRLEKHCGLI